MPQENLNPNVIVHTRTEKFVVLDMFAKYDGGCTLVVAIKGDAFRNIVAQFFSPNDAIAYAQWRNKKL